jgi:hypothetical protein
MGTKNPTLSIVDPTLSIVPPPSNLGPAGLRLWQSILSDYEILDSGGLALLEQIVLAYERAERLRVEIDRDGEIIRGRNGVREHPGLRGELAARSFVARSLQRLGVNLEAVGKMGRPSSLNAR